MDEDSQYKILGQLLNGKRDFAGHHVILHGCRFTPMHVLARLLLNMDFTPTCHNDGEPSIEFYTHEEWLARKCE